jgi:hypothetical protein
MDNSLDDRQQALAFQSGLENVDFVGTADAIALAGVVTGQP